MAITAPVNLWDRRSLIQGAAYARDPRNGNEFIVIAQAQRGGSLEVEDSIFHLHQLINGGLKYLSTMILLRGGHPQSFHARISVKGNLWLWPGVEQYVAGKRVSTRPARVQYRKGEHNIAESGLTYIPGLTGISLSPVPSPSSKGPGTVTIRRAKTLTFEFTEYDEASLIAGKPKALRSVTVPRQRGTYQSAAASAAEVAYVKGATLQKHMIYRYGWDGKATHPPLDITNAADPTGRDTSSEPEAVLYYHGRLHYGKRFNSVDHRVYAIFGV